LGNPLTRIRCRTTATTVIVIIWARAVSWIRRAARARIVSRRIERIRVVRRHQQGIGGTAWVRVMIIMGRINII
jgi:hypothetical protein